MEMLFFQKKKRINGSEDSCEGCPGPCCVVMWVPEINKAAGERCKELTDEGKCGIYSTRPSSCKEWDCTRANAFVRELLEQQSRIIKLGEINLV